VIMQMGKEILKAKMDRNYSEIWLLHVQYYINNTALRAHVFKKRIQNVV